MPAVALLVLAATAPDMTRGSAVAPLCAIGMMGAGMIGSALSVHWRGVVHAAVCGLALALLANTLGLAPLPDPLALTFAIGAASVSFAARGTLFARSGGRRGWWIAVAVLAGEGAMLALTVASPGAVPAWLLALLPAQWASLAVGAAFGVTERGAADAALIALAGTAATTLLAARLWPARWPYLVMFSAWIGFAALVWRATGSAF